ADAEIYYTRAADMRAGVIAAFCRQYSRKSVFAGAGDPDFERKTPRDSKPHHRWLNEYGDRNVDLVLVQNETQRSLCEKNFGRSSVIMPNCYPDPGPEQQGRFDGCVLWVSNIRALKRPELVFELARRLPDARFRMIGGQS